MFERHRAGSARINLPFFQSRTLGEAEISTWLKNYLHVSAIFQSVFGRRISWAAGGRYLFVAAIIDSQTWVSCMPALRVDLIVGDHECRISGCWLAKVSIGTLYQGAFYIDAF